MREDIKAALEVLRKGGVILYPTDAEWELGCDACSETAVQRVFSIKKSISNHSIALLIDNPGRISGFIDEVPEIAFDVIDLTETPLTVILEGAKNLATSIVNPNEQSVGIRVVKETFCQQLIQQFKKPIFSTPANFDGDHSSESFVEIDPEFMLAVDYIVKYRQNELSIGKKPGVLKIGKNGSVKVIRE